jgi:hypothetical protein
VLFFRESTGQLIMERNGLKEAEVRSDEVQLDEENQLVGYRVMLRGPRDKTYQATHDNLVIFQSIIYT